MFRSFSCFPTAGTLLVHILDIHFLLRRSIRKEIGIIGIIADTKEPSQHPRGRLRKITLILRPEIFLSMWANVSIPLGNVAEVARHVLCLVSLIVPISGKLWSFLIACIPYHRQDSRSLVIYLSPLCFGSRSTGAPHLDPDSNPDFPAIQH